MKKADAFSGMVQRIDNIERPAPGNWIKYEDYMELWDAYEWMRLDRDSHQRVAMRAMDRADKAEGALGSTPSGEVAK